MWIRIKSGNYLRLTLLLYVNCLLVPSVTFLHNQSINKFLTTNSDSLNTKFTRNSVDSYLSLYFTHIKYWLNNCKINVAAYSSALAAETKGNLNCSLFTVYLSV